MGFSDRQMRALSRSVPKQHVRSRLREGKELSYVEGWFVLAQANRIFGFDGWDRETVETKCIMGREVRGTFTAVYSARVRVIVHADDRTIIRDGHGTGEAIGQSIGEVHDRALKAAETDATKRALATFGKAFGLALYAGIKPRLRGATARSGKRLRRRMSLTRTDRNATDQLLLLLRHHRQSRSVKRQMTSRHRPTRKPLVRHHPLQPLLRSVRPSTRALSRISEPHRVRDKEHLRFVASQPCLLCSATPSDAHHVRFAQPRAMGRKVGDDFTVPLCRTHHRELHDNGNEAAWWHDMGIDPIAIAGELWNESHPVRINGVPPRPP